ncbi:hypothetical protein BSKO_03405 [Bryopsis sp. KO-2023]|nr:hypothetical protein BSKO_03405 [Bryopsis sp. KO-2023]
MGGSQSACAELHPSQLRIPEPRFVLASDLDFTMVEHSDEKHSSLLAFNNTWISKFRNDSLLIFSTGRSPTLYWELQAAVPLLTPDILVCSVGTEIMHRNDDGFSPDKEWAAKLDDGWNRSVAMEMDKYFDALTLQKESELRPHKVSFNISVTGDEAEEVISDLRNRLSRRGMKAKVIYSGGADVDVLPEGAGKGKALEYLLEKLRTSNQFPPGGVQVNGDSGNDIELFQVPGVKGCMVANAHPELVEWVDENKTDEIFKATKNCAAGILEALHHFGSIPEPDKLSEVADFVLKTCCGSPSDLESAILDDFACIGADGKIHKGKAGVPKLYVSEELSWIDDLAIGRVGENFDLSFQSWRGCGNRTGMYVSGFIVPTEGGLRWKSMHMTSISVNE